MKDVFKQLADIGILPVINISQESDAIPLAGALMKGGIPVLEVTLRSECSMRAIDLIKHQYPEMTIGAGTVLHTSQVDQVMASGADYIVSPGYDEILIKYCRDKNIPIIPGCVTATELQKGVKEGIRIFKFFPAELNGGVEAIKLLSGPFADVHFLPTGGITINNLGSYLINDRVIACGGSFMATSEQLKKHDFEGITAACNRAVDISLGFELAHIGINHDNELEAITTASAIAGIFRLEVKNGNSSVFAGKYVEAMKMPFRGKLGHIGFYTNSMARSLAYFNNCGIAINPDSIRTDEYGTPVSAYLMDEIAGFAIHVVRR